MPALRKSADRKMNDHPDLFDEEAGPRRGRAKAHKKQSGKMKVFWLRLLGNVGIGVLLLPIAAQGLALGGLVRWLESSPGIEEFESYNPPEATILLDRDGNQITSLFEQRRFVTPIQSMPAALPQAFIAVEDERFYEHLGVDPFSVARAMFINITRGRMSQGASTITQQTTRNLLPNIGSEKTLRRKVMELLVALQMEHRYSKDQILEVYLNQIYLGSGNYGVEAAARGYFGRSVDELELWQAATLAGLPQIPERFSPLNNPERAQLRRDIVLWKMLEHDLIRNEQFEEAIRIPVVPVIEPPPPTRAAYFVDAVRRTISDHPDLSGDKLHTAGWRLTTTVDTRLQTIAERVLREGLDEEEVFWIEGRQERFNDAKRRPEYSRAPLPGQVRMAEVVQKFSGSLVLELPGGWRADARIPEATAHYFRDEAITVGQGVDIEVVEVEANRGLMRVRLLPQQRMQGALVCLDVASGDVLALVGGREFRDFENNGFFNRAVQARRQAGSTLKPFFFAAGLERGLTPETLLSDTPLRFADGYAPKNFDNRFMGNVNMEYSLAHSRNIPAFRVVQHVGLRAAARYVAQFQRIGDREWELPNQWPIVLGVTNVTPLEMAAAYQPLANGGVARGPQLLRRIENNQQREAMILSIQPEERLLEERAARNLTRMLAATMEYGSGLKLREYLPPILHDRVAGKSGTTDDNRDAWFAGFTPSEVVVVWVGFDQNIAHSSERTGSRAAGTIWAKYLAEIWADRDELDAGELFLPPRPVIASSNTTGAARQPQTTSTDVNSRELGIPYADPISASGFGRWTPPEVLETALDASEPQD